MIFDRLFDPMNMVRSARLYRVVVLASKVSPVIVKVHDKPTFRAVCRSNIGTPYAGMMNGIFINEYQILTMDRFFIDCETSGCAKVAIKVIRDLLDSEPLIIRTGGRGYHIVVFTRSPGIKDYRINYMVHKARVALIEELVRKGITGYDMYYGSESITYHVIPYVRRGSCIARDSLECVDIEEAVEMINNSVKNPLKPSFIGVVKD